MCLSACLRTEVCVHGVYVCLYEPVYVCQRAVKVRAAHPGFQSALNVPDAPLGMTLGLGRKTTHTDTHNHTRRLLIKTCCINILFRFHVTSRNALIPVAKTQRQKAG